ncbi:hypothetical protein SHKM778_16580 [Streptomyces sp. KM77-8]|uniref:Uncharacterized protein n=1 Tax=Streptomyces haneummycinicus TaxID=3074435 RepID=A0AAT9HCT6_9ACTN
MARVMCPLCSDDEDIEVVRSGEGGGRVVRHRCGYEWEDAAPAAVPRTERVPRSFDELAARFPRAEEVEPGRLRRVDRLKEQYLAVRPDFDPRVGAYWAEYQEIFSPTGCGPAIRGG